MNTYRVSEGTQVNHDGTVYGEGDLLEVDAATAQPWLDGGLLEEVDPSADKPDKRYRRPK